MTPPWRAARRVLAIRLDNLGDVLMTTPALDAIRQSSPGISLTLLGSPAGAGALDHLPPLDDAIAYEAPWMKSGGITAPDAVARDHALIARLAQRRFDAAIVFTVCTQSALPAALMCRLAGIPLRLAHSRENPYDLLTDWVPDRDAIDTGMRHEVQRQLDLVASVGFRPAAERLQFRYAAADVVSLRTRLRQAGGCDRQPYLLVHPGATAASRRWPAERFGIAADAIAQRSGCRVVFCGGPGEQALVDEARARMHTRSVSLAGALSLGELAALIAGAQVLLCNNSGPAHLAAALGTPVVVLYALTNPQHTPWRARARVMNHDVPCRHCLKSICPEGHHDCLQRVGADAVADAALGLMRLPPGVPLPLRPASLESAARPTTHVVRPPRGTRNFGRPGVSS